MRRAPAACRVRPRFEVSDAFHGATEDWTPYFDAERFAKHCGRSPEPGEIGAALSHARVIRGFAAESGSDSDLLLVAEDDARFAPDVEIALSALTGGPVRHDVVVLADGWTRNIRLSIRRQGMASCQISLLSRVIRGRERIYRVGRFAGPADCSGLYLMTRRGARKFDAYVCSLPGGKLDRVSDTWPTFRDLAGLDVALVRPSLATWEGVSTVHAPEAVAREAAAVAAAEALGLRDRFVQRIAVRSRLRGVKLAVWATVDDVRHRMKAARER